MAGVGERSRPVRGRKEFVASGCAIVMAGFKNEIATPSADTSALARTPARTKQAIRKAADPDRKSSPTVRQKQATIIVSSFEVEQFQVSEGRKKSHGVGEVTTGTKYTCRYRWSIPSIPVAMDWFPPKVTVCGFAIDAAMVQRILGSVVNIYYLGFHPAFLTFWRVLGPSWASIHWTWNSVTFDVTK